MSNLAIYAATSKEIAATPSVCDASALVTLLLADKRSDHTKRAYERDLGDFLGARERELLDARAREFLCLSVPEMRLAALAYKTRMRAARLSENTINRRLAALRSLCSFAHRLGQCASDGSNIVEGERVTAYRDTKGVDLKTLRRLVAAPEKLYGHSYIYSGKCVVASADESAPSDSRNENRALHCARDLALLGVLIENALRRGEVCSLDVGDFDERGRALWVRGKGRGGQKERITVSPDLAEKIAAYLVLGGHGEDKGGALFRNLDPRPEFRGGRLTPDGLYSLVGVYGRAVGLNRLTPHQLRHSAITLALDATGGDVRRVQRLSRHKKIETVMVYDDNRADMQGEVSGLLSGLVGGKKKPRAH